MENLDAMHREESEEPVFGRAGVTNLNRFRKDPYLVLLTARRSHAAEEFRKIVVCLGEEESASAGPSGLLMVLSPLEGEGKTLTALNLALALAQDSERRTLLVDFDFRRPRVEEFLVERGRDGLADALREKGSVEDLIQFCPREKLHVLTAGSSAEQSATLLHSENLKPLLAQLRNSFDIVVGDCPPLLPFAESRALASKGDSVVMVVRAESTPRSALTEAVALLDPQRFRGVVLNAVPANRWLRYRYATDKRRKD